MQENHLRLIDIATRNVACLPVAASLGEAARLMAQRRFSSIVVTDDGQHPVGIITERNILQAMRDGLPLENPLRDSMSAPVITLPGEADSVQAYQTCVRANIRHLVLTDGEGVVCGVVSETDFRLHLQLSALAGRRKISSVAKRVGIMLPPEASLGQAVELMHEQHKSCVVVAEQEKPVGIITERDVVRLYSGDKPYADITLREVMVSPVLTIPREATASQAAEEMLALKVRHLVVVDEAGCVAGLLSEHDLTLVMTGGEAEQRGGLEETFLHTLIDTIPDLVWLKDTEGVYLACNTRFEKFFGMPERDIIGKTDYEFVDREQADFFREHDRMSMAADSPLINEEWLVFRDGGYRGLFETIKTPMRGRGGKVIGVLGIARDITERERAKQALQESEHEFRTLAKTLPDNIIRYARDCRVRYMNPAMYVSLPPELLPRVGEIPVESTPGYPLIRRLQDAVEQVMDEDVRVELEFEMPHPDGSQHTHHVIFVPEHDSRGTVIGAIGIGRDISAMREAERTLRVNASVFDTTQDAIIITDACNNIIDVNPAFTRITGYGREEVLGKNPRLLGSGRQDKTFYAAMWRELKERRAWRGEIWNRRKDGAFFAELLSISVITGEDGQVLRYVGVFSDITYFKDHEEELSRVAYYDALTGIPNRRLLADRLTQAIAIAQRSGKMLAVCYIDLDGFKEVNDRYGHQAGDLLLVDITRRLQEVVRAGDTLARLGGDEFVVLFNDLLQETECFQVLERVMQAILEPMVLGSDSVAVSASVGITFYPADDEDGDTLLRHADQAMYVAKQRGKNRFHLYDAEHDQRVRSMHESRRRIRQGLEAGEFELHYQPKQELSSGKIVGVEALIRWNHPELGRLPPAEFLPLIENSELEVMLGDWVIRAALAQLFDWERAGIQVQVSINISAHHLQYPEFVARLKQVMSQFPALRPGSLQIEVLETAALEDIAQSSEVIEACREMGISFALDDFGTGYSSLVYLSRLAADTLKIDQSFIQGMSLNEGDNAIVQGVIALAKTFGRQTVAEGLEDGALAEKLQEMGCGYVQGFSIAQPMSAHDFAQWFRQRSAG